MNLEDRIKLSSLWGAHGTSELLFQIAEIITARIGDMPGPEWQKECRDTARVLYHVSNEFGQSGPISATQLFRNLPHYTKG